MKDNECTSYVPGDCCCFIQGYLKTRPIYECRCDERLKTEADKSIDEMFASCLLLIDKARTKDKTYI